MMKSKRLITMLILCSLLLAGCGGNTNSTASSQASSSSENSSVSKPDDNNTSNETIKSGAEETDAETTEAFAEDTTPDDNTDANTETETTVDELLTVETDNTSENEEPGTISEAFRKNQMNLAVTLFRRQAEMDFDKNMIISPTSISTALALAASGSDMSTRNQMEQFFNQDIDSLNTDMKAYTDSLPAYDTAKCVSANSIWIRQTDEITIKDEFLQTGKDIYHAGIFKEPFDTSTVDKINSWVDENTDHLIPSIINDIRQDSVMYLINALSFDAQWTDSYDESSIAQDHFTTSDGTKKVVSMMSSTEDDYLDDGNATGFIKPYFGGYKFVALLPNENTDIRNYLNTLNGETLAKTITNPVPNCKVHAKLPAFEANYETSMTNTLQNMGLSDAFSPQSANFTKMAESNDPDKNICISDVLHKTYISVDKNGTKAAAATAIMMDNAASALTDPPEYKDVILDRPFIYMIIDGENQLPIFMGIVTDIGN